jgi:hypothetical protein
VLTGALLAALDPTPATGGRVTNLSLADSIDQALRSETQHPLCANSGEPILLTRRPVAAAPVAAPSGRCPYKGLRFFDRDGDDPGDFFGRSALTDELIDRLREHHFLAVVGVSGSGKSSVVRAGLMHQLRLGERIGGSGGWPQVIMLPGSDPLAALHAALIRQTDVDPVAALGLARTGSIAALLSIVTPLAGDGRLVLLIDQFEELFTQVDDPARAAFLACLFGALDQAQGRLCVVITLRADFYAKCADQDYHGLARRIQDQQLIVQPMSAAELHGAITAPAARVGLAVEDGLVTELVSEVRGAPGNLPLLQDSLTELWARSRRHGGLTLEDYHALGGLHGTLARRADAVFEQALDRQQQRAARWILIELTRFGEGTEDTRRRLPRDQLIAPRFGAGLIEQTLDKLADARLLVTSGLQPRAGTGGEAVATVEVAHEALIRHWPRLRRWLNEGREFQTWLRRLRAETADWLVHRRAQGVGGGL